MNIGTLYATELDRNQDRRVKLSMASPDFQKILDALDHPNVSCSFCIATCSFDISIHGDPSLLTRAVRAIKTNGFHGMNRPKKGDVSFTAFYYRKPKDKLEINGPKVWLNFYSDVCTRVQVGTEMREVPIYETRCEGSDLGEVEL
jgi:hypothetical protein